MSNTAVQETQQNSGDTAVYRDDIDMYLDMFCKDHDIENAYDIRPQQWTAAMMYIYQNTFKHDNTALKIPGAMGGAYDMQAVNALLDRYIYLCMEHNQRVSITGFCCLSGIQNNTIYDWYSGKDRGYIYYDLNGAEIPHNKLYKAIATGDYVKKPTTKYSEIYKKLVKFEGQSLEDSLTDRKKNPMHTLPLFNAFQARHAAKTERPRIDTGNIAESLGITADLQGLPDKKERD